MVTVEDGRVHELDVEGDDGRRGLDGIEGAAGLDLDVVVEKIIVVRFWVGRKVEG